MPDNMTIAQALHALNIAKECDALFDRGRQAGLNDIAVERVAEKIDAAIRAAVTEYAQRCHRQYGTIERLQSDGEHLSRALADAAEWLADIGATSKAEYLRGIISAHSSGSEAAQ